MPTMSSRQSTDFFIIFHFKSSIKIVLKVEWQSRGLINVG